SSGSVSESAQAAAYAPTAAAPGPSTGDGGAQDSGLVLGSYRDLWASEVTKRNPALRFLMPTQRLELAAKDARELGLESGDPVTVSADGASVEAVVSVKQRMRAGAAFLIEGTDEQNANLIATGGPRRISVEKRAEPESNGSGNGNGRVKVVETPMPAEGAV
ncbi:MAG: hypothetical protein F9K43_30520, partial [Bauldia sp.]